MLIFSKQMLKSLSSLINTISKPTSVVRQELMNQQIRLANPFQLPDVNYIMILMDVLNVS
jgi:hypothetical protein